MMIVLPSPGRRATALPVAGRSPRERVPVVVAVPSPLSAPLVPRVRAPLRGVAVGVLPESPPEPPLTVPPPLFPPRDPPPPPVAGGALDPPRGTA
jgi:hypothetical protein